MFVYLLIASELAILYTVFWYLYLREPKQARRIVGNTWGAYNPGATNGGDASVYGYEMSAAHCYLQPGQQQAPVNGVKPFMLPVHDEMVLDLSTNHYVPTRPRSTVLGSLIQQLDDCLSEMNVRP